MQLQEMIKHGIVRTGNVTRIGRVMKRAAAGDAITVGFLGGSITQGSLASLEETCYAYLVFDWWRKKFPKAEFTYVNAGIGGTTSQFGVARVKQDLLSRKPDMIITEFSVNDADTALFQETFEGLIRTLLREEKEPGVLMFNNVEYDTGNNAQRVHNEVGAYYDLPIVSMKDSIYAEIEKGTITASDITPDNLHPNDKGHALLCAVITGLLEEIYEQVFSPSYREAGYVMPKTPLTKNRYENAVRYDKRNAEPICNGFVKDTAVQQHVRDTFQNGFFAGKQGASITFIVPGSILMVQYRKSIRKPAPVAKVVVDGNEEAAVILDANFQETWGDCLYLENVAEGLENKEHTVTVTIVECPKEPASEFYLASVITA